MGQLKDLKDKVDPEAYELLRQSAREAIASAQHFLDACDKVIESLGQEKSEEDELDLTDADEEIADVYHIKNETHFQ